MNAFQSQGSFYWFFFFPLNFLPELPLPLCPPLLKPFPPLLFWLFWQFLATCPSWLQIKHGPFVPLIGLPWGTTGYCGALKGPIGNCIGTWGIGGTCWNCWGGGNPCIGAPLKLSLIIRSASFLLLEDIPLFPPNLSLSLWRAILCPPCPRFSSR